MSLSRSRGLSLAVLPLVVTVIGCVSTVKPLDPPEHRDDFGIPTESQPITAESVSETQMLHRRTQIEVKGHAVIPTGFFQSNSFEVGPGVGMKAGIEVAKDFFANFSFDYAHITQGDGVSQVVSDPNSLGGIEPDQLYEEFHRYNFLIGLDHDWTVAKSFLNDNSPLKLRFGGGAGLTVIEGEVDSFLKSQIEAGGSSIKIVDYYGFLLRLSGSVRWEVTDQFILFAEAGYDLVAPFTIEIKSGGQRSEVDGDVDFGSINIGAGIAFQF
ncbi:MAG TPA: hypothetical protein VMT52_12385 [Planctomycetota bacterium]|nr:hypothetical protein [Planctomycetota bacterium]